jgi:Zn finger protein HypA/HybF involved in hydrogenase expression
MKRNDIVCDKCGKSNQDIEGMVKPDFSEVRCTRPGHPEMMPDSYDLCPNCHSAFKNWIKITQVNAKKYIISDDQSC